VFYKILSILLQSWLQDFFLTRRLDLRKRKSKLCTRYITKMMRRVRNENWTEEETQALQKAIQHQSAKCETNTGSLNQFWEKVTRNVNEKSKTTRTLAQVKEKVKNLKKKNVVCPLPSTKKVAAKKAQKCLPIRKPSETENSHNGTSRNGYSSKQIDSVKTRIKIILRKLI